MEIERKPTSIQIRRELEFSEMGRELSEAVCKIVELQRKERELTELKQRYCWRPISEIHEDYSDVVLTNINDPGDVWIGSNLDMDFDESKWTHFTRFAPLGQEEYERMKAEVAAPTECD